VAVLLCTYDGDAFLAAQLESIAAQRGPDVRLYVSDDGSSDGTLELLKHYQVRWSEDRLSIRHGPRQGYVANFFFLVCASDISAETYAYADQDDLWDADKLSRATAALCSLPAETPALYCSRSRLIDEQGAAVGYSPLFRKPPGFANALVQNIGGGNTMVFNHAARELLRAAGPVDVVSHDWWTYLLVAGAGGTVIYDPEPSISYRQHGHNLIGSNMSFRERVARLRMVLRSRNREWNDRHVNTLQQCRLLLAPDNLEVLEQFSSARNEGLIPRLLGVWNSGIYAQTLLGNLGMIAATFLKKI
tara:strand:+ start:60173 stop:61081 length:909 start_codon:yes stop_codon:yes gene_type:complete